MTRSDSIQNLAAALVKAQPHIKGAAKSSINPHFKSKYADLAEVADACLPALNEAGIAVLQPASWKDGMVYVTTMLVHGATGEFIAEELGMIPTQGTPQAVGSCLTYARRYGLASMVGVAPEDDDGNAASEQKSHSADKALDKRGWVNEAMNRPPQQPPRSGYYKVVDVQKGFGAAVAVVKLVNANGEQFEYAVFKEVFAEAARQALRNDAEVEIELKTSKAGKDYLSQLAYVGAASTNESDWVDEKGVPF